MLNLEQKFERETKSLKDETKVLREETNGLRNKIASLEATSKQKRSIGTIDSIYPYDNFESDIPVDSLDDIADFWYNKGRTPRTLVSFVFKEFLSHCISHFNLIFFSLQSTFADQVSVVLGQIKTYLEAENTRVDDILNALVI